MAADPRRLLIVSHGYPPYYGGAEHAAAQMASQAVAAGKWHVDVLTSDIGGRLPAREVAGSVNITRVATWKRSWSRHNVPELASFLMATRSFEPAEKPDLIIAHFTLPAGEVARRFSRRYDVPYLVVLHGSDVPHYQNERFGMLYHVTKPWVRSIWQDALAVVAVSAQLGALANQSWPAGMIDIIPNGVDTDRFSPSICGEVEKTNELRLIVNAQLIERKGIHHLLGAIAVLQPEDRDRVRLDICGTGPQETVLRNLVDSRGLARIVHFHGLVDYEQIPGRLRAADVFILPSFQEGMPLALLEAMACGLPVIATRVGAIPDVVTHRESGYLVRRGDEAAMALAIQQFIHQPSLCRIMGEAARAAAMGWSWRMAWSKYEDLIERVLVVDPRR